MSLRGVYTTPAASTTPPPAPRRRPRPAHLRRFGGRCRGATAARRPGWRRVPVTVPCSSWRARGAPPAPCPTWTPLPRVRRVPPRAPPAAERRPPPRGHGCSPAWLAPGAGGGALCVVALPPRPCVISPPLPRVRRLPPRAPPASERPAPPGRQRCSPAGLTPATGGGALFVLALPARPSPPSRRLPSVRRVPPRPPPVAQGRPPPWPHRCSPAGLPPGAGWGALFVAALPSRPYFISPPLRRVRRLRPWAPLAADRRAPPRCHRCSPPHPAAGASGGSLLFVARPCGSLRAPARLAAAAAPAAVPPSPSAASAAFFWW